ncbi:MAG TPA: tRNA (adenosine(37)-N6)-threonylcarbamoyltransferase complex ATPase subunit type 1 TsaE [Candidatus Woesebacteria bacterium]|nr:tRNA (adenosine(37)-N6)-threonylcarbamoyltransferase complex ATPase subunit type 1 TsaE [Candidatus Woesebacteria bacterium]
MEETYISTSYEETREIAEKIASILERGTTICLYGDLAAGKTTFSQGIGKYFGIDRVVSPTFIIMRQYPVANHPTIKTFYHLDLYRLNSVEEIRAFDIEEIWSDPSNILIIEWPEKLADILPQKRFDIFFKANGENERVIKIIEHK